MMDLGGKNCVVTGSTRGIGLATAYNLAKHGAHVFINGRESTLVNSIVDDFNQNGLSASAFVCDVSKYDEIKAAFRSYHLKHKKLDVLVNNAGVLDDALVGMVSQDQIHNTFAINTFSVINFCQIASRFMSKVGEGSIVNLSSIIGLNGNSGQVVYGASKAAVVGITKSLAKELASKNIRVNAIAPGFIDTDMARTIPSEIFKERIESIAMGRIGTAEEVSDVILFLASDYSSYVTGQVIGVDGGMLI